METVVLPHLSQHPLSVCCFTDVKNASFLRQQLLDGNAEFEYGFLDAAMLLSRQHVFAACFRAVNDMLRGRLKSRNVHSEIVFSLSPNNNMAESFRRFGISDDSQHILAIKVGGDASRVAAHLQQSVDGKTVAFTDNLLSEIHDSARIRKVYRVEGSKDELLSKEVEAFVVGSMALKGS